MRRFVAALKTRGAGLLLIVLGVLALSTPLAVGRWSLTVLGIPLLALGLIEAHAAFKSPRRGQLSAYLPGALAVLAGNLLLLSSALVISGLLVLRFAILLADGAGKLLTVWRKPPAERAPAIVNALIDFAAAALLWWLDRSLGAERAIGIVIGLYIAAAGWRLMMAPAETAAPAAGATAPTIHPDPRLGLPPNEAFARLRAATEAAAPTVRASDLMWMLTLGGVFLAIHIGRMPISDTLLGVVSPLV